MGIRIRNEGAVGVRLSKYGGRSTRQLRRVTSTGADMIAEVAGEMAPFRTGDLEGDISVKRVREGRRISHVISTVNVPYAVYMHESEYKLGPGSRQKNATSRFRVGRKFLTRAVNYVKRDYGLLRRARDAMKAK